METIESSVAPYCEVEETACVTFIVLCMSEILSSRNNSTNLCNITASNVICLFFFCIIQIESDIELDVRGSSIKNGHKLGVGRSSNREYKKPEPGSVRQF